MHAMLLPILGGHCRQNRIKPSRVSLDLISAGSLPVIRTPEFGRRAFSIQTGWIRETLRRELVLSVLFGEKVVRMPFACFFSLCMENILGRNV